MKVLLANELGGGIGHTKRLYDLACILKNHGHKCRLYLSDLSALQYITANKSTFPFFQSPKYTTPPELRIRMIGRKPPPKAGRMSDLLALHGFGKPEILKAVLECWHNTLQTFKPDLVITDFAPGLLLAARGSVPSINVGNGFTIPPSFKGSFPAWDPSVIPWMREADLLQSINKALSDCSLTPLPYLSDLIKADASMIMSYPLFDPFQYFRPKESAYYDPLQTPAEKSKRSQGWFAYLSLETPYIEDLFFGLVHSGLPGQCFIPLITDSLKDYLEDHDIRVWQTLPPVQAYAHANFIISNGGLGVTQFAFAAGIPQMLMPRDFEKEFYTARILQHGGGYRVVMDRNPVEQISDFAKTVHHDQELDAYLEQNTRMVSENQRTDTAGAFINIINNVAAPDIGEKTIRTTAS